VLRLPLRDSAADVLYDRRLGGTANDVLHPPVLNFSQIFYVDSDD
jgi:hypothetical protein